MNTTSKEITLNNGMNIPLVGLGTAGLNDKDSIVTAIVSNGYRHIDTAAIYKNESIVGDALQEVFEKGITWEELFITTKLWVTDFTDPMTAI